MTKNLAIIGGSGLYDLPDLTQVEAHALNTPFGSPSDQVVTGLLGDVRLFFLPRHGRGHRLSPSEVNYRANIWALKQLGATQVLSISAVGSLKEALPPGHLVICDQFIDRTFSRATSFFEGSGVVAHVSLADPTDLALRQALGQAASHLELPHQTGGTYLNMEGPHFSTRAESALYRSWGLDVIGMTNATEAKLAREAELPYATAAFVTDYDCWRESEEAVSAEEVMGQLKRNTQSAQALLRALLPRLPDPALSPASTALRSGLITQPNTIDDAAKARLGLLLAPYLAGSR